MIFQWIRYKKPKSVFLKKRTNENMLIVCSKELNIYYLNQTAAFLLNSSNGENSIDDIKKDMLAKYEVEEGVLENDLVDTFRDLQWKNLIVMEE